jgi:hypothetical protein
LFGLFLFDGFIIALVNPLNHQQCQCFLMLKQHFFFTLSIILKKFDYPEENSGQMAAVTVYVLIRNPYQPTVKLS